jgi:hypothetical protein
MKPLLILAILFPVEVFASTFVGNGGSPGDVEIAVALKQVHDVFANVGSDDQGLCSCEDSEFQNHSVCDTLSDLKNKQARFCSDFLVSHANKLKALTSPEAIDVEWTHEKISVKDGGTLRAVDAVADQSRGVITVNQDRFLEMKPYERIFLLTHELMHFTKTDGQYLSDEGAIGPFEGADGKRKLINSVAAAAVVLASDDGVLSRNRSTLDRPQGWKTNWIAVQVGSGSLGANDSVYAMDRFNDAGVTFRKFLWGRLGVVATYDHLSYDKTILTQIKAKENVSILGAGISYRWFPFEDPLKWSGQTHFVFSGLVEFLRGKYDVDDTFVQLSNSTSSVGVGLQCSYFFPILKFWGFVSLNGHLHHYEYSDFQLKYDKPFTTQTLGVGYAF